MNKLIKIITVLMLCGIVIFSLLYMLAFRSDGGDLAVSRADVIISDEPVITISQEDVDPIVVEETEEPIESNKPVMSREDVELIALVTMAEAEGECEEGKRLVIDTILNRVDSEYFPNSVHDVIYQRHQFSSMWDGRVDECVVLDSICSLVYEELEKRTNYDVMFFTARRYSIYGIPMFKVGNHCFSRYE